MDPDPRVPWEDTPVPTDPSQKRNLENELHAILAKGTIVVDMGWRDPLPLVLPIVALKILYKGFIPNLTQCLLAATVKL